MKGSSVIFIAVRDYDNLGIGYMEAILSTTVFDTKIIDFKNNKNTILRIIKRENPFLVGFSVIFQYYIDKFIDLIRFLREEGIESHFTAGGHYASLKYQELFDFIPELDSIVRGEGEYILRDLANSLYKGSDWRKLKGLVYKKDGELIANPPRPFEKDLDRIPFPKRGPLKKYAFTKKFATLIAGRGCIYNCTFCNEGKFYTSLSGPVKRIRKPEMVVREMDYLYHKRKCRVFIFFDDDFPIRTVNKYEWVLKFCDQLDFRKLSGRIMWRVSCRPDEVDEEIFSKMKKTGLFQVFLGIEDGTDRGLKNLNKHMTLDESIQGINILKKLKIGIDFGFMLFQPSTTFSSLNENISFLKVLSEDGYTPVTFLKLMPYYKTAVEQQLKKEGRLKISKGIRDYDFLDDKMDHYYDFITLCFMEWLRYSGGLENISHWARNYFAVFQFYSGTDSYFSSLKRKFKKAISESNLFLLDTMSELSVLFESGKYKTETDLLEDYREKITSMHDYFKKLIYYYIDLLLMHGQVYL